METNKKQKTQFQIWAINYFLAPFSWSRWTDIKTFQYGDTGCLLQGKMNSRTNAKKFKITTLNQKITVYKTQATIETLDACGLIDSKVKFNFDLQK